VRVAFEQRGQRPRRHHAHDPVAVLGAARVLETDHALHVDTASRDDFGCQLSRRQHDVPEVQRGIVDVHNVRLFRHLGVRDERPGQPFQRGQITADGCIRVRVMHFH